MLEPRQKRSYRSLSEPTTRAHKERAQARCVRHLKLAKNDYISPHKNNLKHMSKEMKVSDRIAFYMEPEASHGLGDLLRKRYSNV